MHVIFCFYKMSSFFKTVIFHAALLVFTWTLTLPVNATGDCRTFGSCSQRCHLENSSCSCVDGFYLDSNRKSCLPRDPAWKLLFVTNGAVHLISRDGSGPEYSKQLFTDTALGNIIGIDFDYENNFAYWTDNTQGKQLIQKGKVNGTGSVETVIDVGLGVPEGIAFDWITGNIYVADYKLAQIIVCSQNPRICAVLIEDGMEKPRDIALRPNHGIMFWTDWGDIPVIMRAGMDGESALQIITTGLGWPNAIAVDEGNSRIYWADAKLNKLESSLFDGSDRQTLPITVQHPFGLDVFGDRIYWSDWSSKYVKSADKFTGSSPKIHKTYISANGVVLMHKTKQPKLRPNPCANANCSHVCTLSSESSLNGYKCHCPFGRKIDQSNKNICTDDETKPKLLIAFENTLIVMHLDTIGKDVFEKVHLPESINYIKSLVYNPNNQSVIMSVIDFTFSNSIVQYKVKSKEYSIVAAENVVNVTAMTLDYLTQNLYWVDSSKNTIESISLITGTRIVLLTMANILDILFIPPTSGLCISKSESIYMLHFGKNNTKATALTLPNREPTSLFYDHSSRQIFWVSKKDNKIEFIPTPTIASINTTRVYAVPKSTVHDIIKFKNTLIWIDASASLQFATVGLFFVQIIKTVSVPGINNLSESTIALMNNDVSLIETPYMQNECAIKNRNRKMCSHFCLPTSPIFGECRCPYDHGLCADQVTCVSAHDIITGEAKCPESDKPGFQATTISDMSIVTEQVKVDVDQSSSATKNIEYNIESTSQAATIEEMSNSKDPGFSEKNSHKSTIIVLVVIIVVLLGIIVSLIRHWRRTRSIPLITKPFFIQ